MGLFKDAFLFNFSSSSTSKPVEAETKTSLPSTSANFQGSIPSALAALLICKALSVTPNV